MKNGLDLFGLIVLFLLLVVIGLERVPINEENILTKEELRAIQEEEQRWDW